MNIKNYTIGFVLSLALTLSSFALVEMHLESSHEWPPHTFIIPAVLIFALLQFAVQIIFFLHLASSASRERLIALGLAVTVVLILVGGSLWIMQSLNGRTMPNNDAMTQYMSSQQGI